MIRKKLYPTHKYYLSVMWLMRVTQHKKCWRLKKFQELDNKNQKN